MLKRKKHWVQHRMHRLRKPLPEKKGAFQVNHDNFSFLQFTQVKTAKTSCEMVRWKMGEFINCWNKEAT